MKKRPGNCFLYTVGGMRDSIPPILVKCKVYGKSESVRCNRLCVRVIILFIPDVRLVNAPAGVTHDTFN